MTRRRWAAAAGAVAVAALGLLVGLSIGSGGGSTRVCNGPQLLARQGETLRAARVPKGMVVTAGSTSHPRSAAVVYSVPSLKDGPYVRLRVIDRTSLSGLAPADFTTQAATVEGHPALLAQPPKLLTTTQTAEMGKGDLYWQPGSGEVITMETFELAPSAMLYVADGVVYTPGTLVPVPGACR